MWNQSEGAIAALSEFVRGGGGLVTAGIGWSWASRHPHLDLVRDFAGNRLLAPAGIQWSRDGLSSQGYYAVNGPPDELTHAAWALDAVEAHATGRRTLAQSEIDQSSEHLDNCQPLPACGRCAARTARAGFFDEQRRGPMAHGQTPDGQIRCGRPHGRDALRDRAQPHAGGVRARASRGR